MAKTLAAKSVAKPKSLEEVRLCLVGVGQWGAHVLRAFTRTSNSRVVCLCDLKPESLDGGRMICPGARHVRRIEDALCDPEIDALAIATDAATHASLGLAALRAGKHVFIEKPLATSSADARELIAAASAAKRVLMVGHLLQYHPALTNVEQTVRSSAFGDLLYAYTQRINLGIVRKDENAWWSLAPHDIAVMCRMFVHEPQEVAAQGQCVLQPDIEDVVFATLRFGEDRIAHIHVSWLDPHKIRKMTLVGTRKMITFDDMSANEKVRVYDKGVDRLDELTMRTGDIVIPKTSGVEPLVVECSTFVDCVRRGVQPLTDGEDGLRVVRVLEAGQKSLRGGGGFVPVESA